VEANADASSVINTVFSLCRLILDAAHITASECSNGVRMKLVKTDLARESILVKIINTRSYILIQKNPSRIVKSS
jgi:hypothetical protein